MARSKKSGLAEELSQRADNALSSEMKRRKEFYREAIKIHKDKKIRKLFDDYYTEDESISINGSLSYNGEGFFYQTQTQYSNYEVERDVLVCYLGGSRCEMLEDFPDLTIEEISERMEKGIEELFD